MKKNITNGSIYNKEYDTEVLRSDIIQVMPNQSYRLIVSLDSCKGNSKITPTISLPQKKGYMKVDDEEYNYMISTCNSINNPVCEIDFLSETGIIDISYHCEVLDYRNKSYWGSSKILRPLGMKKEVLSSSKVRYCCTDMKSGLFDRYVFTLEWFKL